MAGSVAVITGASSGIGEATAYRLAERGMAVVLAARSRADLQRVARECEARGVEALAVVCDVSKEDDVDRLAQAALERFGSFDVWVNNAAVTLLGAFTDIPQQMFRQVIEVNFFGYVYGARAALRHFQDKQQGMIINVASVFGMVPSPYESPYVASKFAVRGFSAALRQEMDTLGFRHIDVCTVLPSTIDTPIYRDAANLTGRAVRPVPPLYAVDKVAACIEGVIDEPRAEVIVGQAGRLLALVRVLLPAAVFERLFGRYIEAAHFKHDVSVPVSAGNLFNPGLVHAPSGDWPRMRMPRKAVTAALVVGAAAALGYAAYRLRKERS